MTERRMDGRNRSDDFNRGRTDGQIDGLPNRKCYHEDGKKVISALILYEWWISMFGQRNKNVFQDCFYVIYM